MGGSPDEGLDRSHNDLGAPTTLVGGQFRRSWTPLGLNRGDRHQADRLVGSPLKLGLAFHDPHNDPLV
jgi:hypothetical protein